MLAEADSNQLAAELNVLFRAQTSILFSDSSIARHRQRRARQAPRRTGKEWQDRFRLPEQIPVTLVAARADGRNAATEFLDDAIVRNDAADHVRNTLVPNSTLVNKSDKPGIRS